MGTPYSLTKTGLYVISGDTKRKIIDLSKNGQGLSRLFSMARIRENEDEQLLELSESVGHAVYPSQESWQRNAFFLGVSIPYQAFHFESEARGEILDKISPETCQKVFEAVRTGSYEPGLATQQWQLGVRSLGFFSISVWFRIRRDRNHAILDIVDFVLDEYFHESPDYPERKAILRGTALSYEAFRIERKKDKLHSLASPVY